MGVEGPSGHYFLAALVAAFEKLEVAGNSAALLVVHFARALVADPGVGATTTRVDPEDVFEAKVFSESDVDCFDSHGDEPPALETNARTRAACPDVIVIRHIDIEYQLLH